jgi:hypothetical protein
MLSGKGIVYARLELWIQHCAIASQNTEGADLDATSAICAGVVLGTS